MVKRKQIEQNPDILQNAVKSDAKITLEKIVWMNKTLCEGLETAISRNSPRFLRSTVKDFNKETHLLTHVQHKIDTLPVRKPVKIAICGNNLPKCMKKNIEDSLIDMSPNVVLKIDPPYVFEEENKHEVHYIRRRVDTRHGGFDFWSYDYIIFMVNTVHYMEEFLWDRKKIEDIMGPPSGFLSEKQPKLMILDSYKNNSFLHLLQVFRDIVPQESILPENLRYFEDCRVWRLLWNGKKYTNLPRIIISAISSFLKSEKIGKEQISRIHI
ncbi:unnamed protein product [Hymenolepis diminuta]|uniref:SRR1 domain-containing protein n=1 Tax=Hymenolepis diminuta TaxID=6216 RepID=A0A0R3S7R8_HYMDI|nr:unnamed protein product [Hymenolepis diminuta]VUZ43666.1 unnamed protein product [Hymenolepis diminuta]